MAARDAVTVPKPVRAFLVAMAICVATVGPVGPFDVPAFGEVVVSTAWAQGTETEPLDPVVGRDGVTDEPNDRRSYLLLCILAVCLIGAGTLLVKLERWERKRSEH